MIRLLSVCLTCQVQIKCIETSSGSSSDSVISALWAVMSNVERVVYCPALISCSDNIQTLNIIKLQVTETSETFFNMKKIELIRKKIKILALTEK